MTSELSSPELVQSLWLTAVDEAAVGPNWHRQAYKVWRTRGGVGVQPLRIMVDYWGFTGNS